MAEEGFSWGILPNLVDTTTIAEYGWDGSDQGHGSIDPWMTEDSTTVTASWSSALGDLQLSIGDSFVSPVMDRGVTSTKSMDLVYDSTGVELLVVKWRGSAVLFSQHHASPSWENYNGNALNKSWRYVQLLVRCIERIQIDGEDITIGGEQVGM